MQSKQMPININHL